MSRSDLLDDCIDWNRRKAAIAREAGEMEDFHRYNKNIDELESLKREVNEKG